MPGVATDQVALAIFAGVVDALGTRDEVGSAHGITLVEFDNGDHAFDALK